MQLKIETGALVSLSPADAKIIRPAIAYKEEIAVQVRKGKGGRKVREQREITKYAWAHKSKDMYLFYRGNLPRVLAYLKKKNIPYNITGKFTPLPYTDLPLAGITLRDYQNKLKLSALSSNRGVIHAATGIGKSAVLSGIIAACPDARCLIIAHMTDLVSQLTENITAHLQEPVTKLTTAAPTSSTRINIVTIQSLNRFEPADYATQYDIILVDECHMVSKYDGSYAKVLTNITTPHRFGTTATLPTKPSAKLALESLIGPVVSTYGINTAAKEQVLSKPKIVLLKVEKNIAHSNIKIYKEALRKNLVENQIKNDFFLDCAQRLNNKGMSVLLLVNMIEHGQNLQARASHTNLGNIPFVYQGVPQEERTRIKKALIDKKIMTVIGSNVWKIGIDIPSLGAVIIAGGGKSQIQTIQSIGRGLRRTQTKDTITIVDVFDPSCKWMTEHFAERLTIYFEQGWMGNSIDDL